jgi:hypothetical protein
MLVISVLMRYYPRKGINVGERICVFFDADAGDYVLGRFCSSDGSFYVGERSLEMVCDEWSTN